jgi:cell division protein FtsQ
MDPRIRDRRIEVARAAGRRRLRVLMLCAGAAMAVGVGYLVVNSPLLDIDQIQVVGANHVENGDVVAASGAHRHDALVLVDTRAIVRRVSRLTWVQGVVVHRVFPGTLRIVVTEYTPSAYVRTRAGVLLIGADGRVITRVARPPARVVEVRGVRQLLAPGELLAPPEAAGIIARLPRALAARVAAVDVGGVGVAVDLKGGGVVRLGGADALEAKAAAALAVLARIGATPFAYLDVSTPETPVLHR